MLSLDTGGLPGVLTSREGSSNIELRSQWHRRRLPRRQQQWDNKHNTWKPKLSSRVPSSTSTGQRSNPDSPDEKLSETNKVTSGEVATPTEAPLRIPSDDEIERAGKSLKDLLRYTSFLNNGAAHLAAAIAEKDTEAMIKAIESVRKAVPLDLTEFGPEKLPLKVARQAVTLRRPTTDLNSVFVRNPWTRARSDRISVHNAERDYTQHGRKRGRSTPPFEFDLPRRSAPTSVAIPEQLRSGKTVTPSQISEAGQNKKYMPGLGDREYNRLPPTSLTIPERLRSDTVSQEQSTEAGAANKKRKLASERGQSPLRDDGSDDRVPRPPRTKEDYDLLERQWHDKFPHMKLAAMNDLERGIVLRKLQSIKDKRADLVRSLSSVVG